MSKEHDRRDNLNCDHGRATEPHRRPQLQVFGLQITQLRFKYILHQCRLLCHGQNLNNIQILNVLKCFLGDSPILQLDYAPALFHILIVDEARLFKITLGAIARRNRFFQREISTLLFLFGLSKFSEGLFGLPELELEAIKSDTLNVIPGVIELILKVLRLLDLLSNIRLLGLRLQSNILGDVQASETLYLPIPSSQALG